MKSARDLSYMLRDIDRRGYPAYKDLRGRYEFGDFVLSIDHVQGDPFASPSKASVFMAHEDAGFPREWVGLAEKSSRASSRHAGHDASQSDRETTGQNKRPALSNSSTARQRRRALEDFLVRRLSRELARSGLRGSGSGKSGLLATSRPGPEVLERTACEVTSEGIIVRFEVGLPAHGRRIDGRAAEDLLLDAIPAAVRETLAFADYDKRSASAAREAIELADDQLFIRNELSRQGLVAFVANGSVLPRESGASSRPMHGARAFVSPKSLEVTLDLPHRGPTKGMGIKQGITLIVGGGYHGKSTLLQALQAGVYDHVAGDGREFVITENTACKLRAEDGRAVHDVDVSNFIGELPNGLSTRCFSTSDASGSTSQAANLVEDLEAGCKTLLIDEDTSATNFMVRDALMEQVVNRNQEPITPFVERARDLWERAGVSTVIVAGSSGAFFYVADTVIQMDHYEAHDVTSHVREVLAERDAAGKQGVAHADGFALPQGGRKLGLGGTNARDHDERGRGDHRHGYGSHGGYGHGGRDHRLKVRTQGRESLQVGDLSCDLRLVEQVVDSEQVATLAQMVRYCLEHSLLRDDTVEQAVDDLCEQVVHGGLPAIGSTPYATSGLAMPRKQEIYACLNRLRER